MDNEVFLKHLHGDDFYKIPEEYGSHIIYTIKKHGVVLIINQNFTNEYKKKIMKFSRKEKIERINE
jgi:hypothetical protein